MFGNPILGMRRAVHLAETAQNQLAKPCYTGFGITIAVSMKGGELRQRTDPCSLCRLGLVVFVFDTFAGGFLQTCSTCFQEKGQPVSPR